uniref:OmpA family protein n=1 Tax=Aliarcobacter sp. TaxID=2321116 RepID=UPI0040488E7F
MKKVLLSTVACATMLLAANDYKYEITPMLGGVYTESNLDLERNYANGGLSFGFNLFDSVIDQVELGFLRTIDDVEYKNGTNADSGITRVFANIVKEYSLTQNTSLYSLIGFGGEFFDNELAGNENGVFGNYGVGIKYKIADQFALKFDVRHLIETDHGDNNLLYNVGFAIPFGEVAKPMPVVEEKPEVVPAPVVVAPKDSDNDGVIDSLDKCPNTLPNVKVDSDGCLVLINLNINFDTDSSEIKDSYNSRIVEFATMLKMNPKLKATIEAHTDSDGSNAYNQKLSERRAASTVKALKALNVDVSKINSVGYGETKPVASNETKEGKTQNRRVHAVINK